MAAASRTVAGGAARRSAARPRALQAFAVLSRHRRVVGG